MSGYAGESVQQRVAPTLWILAFAGICACFSDAVRAQNNEVLEFDVGAGAGRDRNTNIDTIWIRRPGRAPEPVIRTRVGPNVTTYRRVGRMSGPDSGPRQTYTEYRPDQVGATQVLWGRYDGGPMHPVRWNDYGATTRRIWESGWDPLAGWDAGYDPTAGTLPPAWHRMRSSEPFLAGYRARGSRGAGAPSSAEFQRGGLPGPIDPYGRSEAAARSMGYRSGWNGTSGRMGPYVGDMESEDEVPLQTYTRSGRTYRTAGRTRTVGDRFGLGLDRTGMLGDRRAFDTGRRRFGIGRGEGYGPWSGLRGRVPTSPIPQRLQGTTLRPQFATSLRPEYMDREGASGVPAQPRLLAPTTLRPEYMSSSLSGGASRYYGGGGQGGGQGASTGSGIQRSGPQPGAAPNANQP